MHASAIKLNNKKSPLSERKRTLIRFRTSIKTFFSEKGNTCIEKDGEIFFMASNAAMESLTSFDLSKAMTFSKIFTKIDLTPSARLVLRCLVDLWNPSKGKVFPTQKTLETFTGVKSRSITNAIDELRQKELIETKGDTGKRLDYYFTAKFFELVKTAEGIAKIAKVTTAKIAQHEQKNHEQSMNRKSNLLSFPNQPKGMEYPKFIPEERIRDERTPENDFETAKKFVCDLWSMKDNHLVRAKLEKVLTIWGQDKFEQFQEPQQNLQGCNNCVSDYELNYSSQF